MAKYCTDIDHADAELILSLLNSNDSELWKSAQMHNVTSKALLPIYRHNLSELLISIIPGKLLTECVIYNWIWTLVPFFILIFGTFGNVFSTFVLLRRSMRNLSTYIYLATLAIIDEIILLTGLFRKWIEYLTNFSIENHSTIFCKSFQVLGVSLSFISVWLIVTLTCERVLIIKRPFNAPKYSKPSRAKYLIIILLLISLSISCHFFETVTLTLINNSTIKNAIYECTFKNNYLNFRTFWLFFDGIMYSWLPLVLLIKINIIIIVEIYRATRNRFNMTNNSVHLANNRSKDVNIQRETKQLTIMLLIVSMSFLLTTSPLVILKLLLRILGRPISLRSTVKLELIDAIFEMLMYINHAVNFYLYCATGSKFRKQLLSLLHCKSYSYEYNSTLQMTTNHGGRNKNKSKERGTEHEHEHETFCQ